MVQASNGIDIGVEDRTPRDDQSHETVPARRARLRDARRVARVAAGAARRNVDRGRPGRHSHNRPAVQAGLWAASSVHATMMGSLWISADGDAIADVSPISGPGTVEQRVRLLSLVALIGIGLNVPLAVIGPAAVDLAALLFLGLALFLAAQTRRHISSPLWHARRQLLVSIHGPAVEVSNLASESSGAGMALLREICQYADDTETTIIADADGIARVRLYRPLGLEPVFTGPEPWKPSLLIRRPHGRPPGRNSSAGLQTRDLVIAHTLH